VTFPVEKVLLGNGASVGVDLHDMVADHTRGRGPILGKAKKTELRAVRRRPERLRIYRVVAIRARRT
jgi:hypothetical protein